MRPIVYGLILGWLALVNARAHELSCDEILEKFIAASEDESILARRNSYSYTRSSTIEYLKEGGEIKNRVRRVYEITPEDGKPVTRLILLNGRPASENDEKKSSARETGEKSRRLSISGDLLERYEFSLKGMAKFNSRPVYALVFEPKPGVESDGFFDRLINSMHGELWIDAEEFQLAKADVHLTKKVSFFGGIAGAIEKLDLSFSQRRLQQGVWLPETTIIDFDGRKLFSDIRFRCFELCERFEDRHSRQANATVPAPSAP